MMPVYCVNEIVFYFLALCYVSCCPFSNLETILPRKRELVDFTLVVVLFLFLMVPWVSL